MTGKRQEPAARRRARRVFWLLAAVITVLALYPRLTLPEPGATEGVTHSYNHILAFATLILVGSLAWGWRRQLVVGLTIYAVALELAQTVSPGRQTTLADMAASLAGVAIGCVLVLILRITLRHFGRHEPANPAPETTC